MFSAAGMDIKKGREQKNFCNSCSFIFQIQNSIYAILNFCTLEFIVWKIKD